MVVLIVIVVTSAIILLLVKSGVLAVQDGQETIKVINQDFLPFGSEGNIIVKDFKFCDFVDTDYNCLGESNEFFLGSEIHFLFVVESSTLNGQVILSENYRIKDPFGNLILAIDESENFNVDFTSRKEKETITFKDYFFVSEDLSEGEYTLELVIGNSLFSKEATLVEKFNLKEVDEEFSEGEFDAYEVEFPEIEN